MEIGKEGACEMEHFQATPINITIGKLFIRRIY